MCSSVDGQKTGSSLVIENNDTLDSHICICVDIYFSCEKYERGFTGSYDRRKYLQDVIKLLSKIVVQFYGLNTNV